MRNRPTVLYFSPAGRQVPDLISSWIEAKQFRLVRYDDREVAEVHAVRSPPNFVVVDADGEPSEGAAFCRNLKSDPYTSIVPVAIVASAHAAEDVTAWFDAGADEVITPLFEASEQRGRLDSLLLRTERNVSVHPSTRLPGTMEIEREMRRILSFPHRMVVLETTWGELSRGEWRSGITPTQAAGSILGWQSRNIPFLLAGSRERAAALTERWLRIVHRRAWHSLRALTENAECTE